MKRRAILSATGGAVLITAVPAFAQTRRAMRLGILGSGLLWDLDSFAKEMRTRGWEVGRNLLVESRLTMGDVQRYRPFAKQLVDARVDVIFADGDVAAIAAFNATRSIPIVMHATSPVEMGMAKSLARPGGNVTGMVYQVQDYVGKELDLLRAIQPELKRMGIAYVDHVNFQGVFKAWTAAGDKTGVAMVKLPWPASKAEIEVTLAAARRERVQVIEFSGNFALRSAEWDYITAWAIESKVLTSRGANLPGEAVLSFGANGPRFMEQLLNQLDRVLRGAKPAEMPIQQPSVFDIVVNRKIARAMGLTLPQSVLLLATEVIE